MANDIVAVLQEPGFVEAEVFLSPLPGYEPIRVKAPVGSLVKDILPADARAPMVCIIDGVPMKREWWMQRPVCEGDRIQFAPVYLGGNDNSRSILAAVAAIVIAYFAPYAAGALVDAGLIAYGGAAYYAVIAGITLVGNALVSALIRPGAVDDSSTNEADRPSSVYNVDTQGNASRIFSPIPVQYGRMKYYPNYACQPYVNYYQYPLNIPVDVFGGGTENAGTQIDHRDGVQYYFALYCLGQGEYDVHSIMIGDANIRNFRDVLRAKILPPGERSQWVHPCVVSSEVVSGLSLDNGEFVGGFPCCGPARKTHQIWLDFVFPQGLASLDEKGRAAPCSIGVYIQARKINQAGLPLNNWVTVAEHAFYAASLTPQRRTVNVMLEESARWEVRVQRRGAYDPQNREVISSLSWAALRALLDEDAPLCKTATHLELVMRASEQLSNISQRKVSVIATRKIPSWDSSVPTATRSPARALWDKWTNPVYGDGMPRDRIDIEALKRYDELSKKRLDRFDYVFEDRVSSQEADQTIAKVMRCVALQRQGVKTIVRDELCETPLTMFNPTNTAENSVSLNYLQITEETTDGVIAEYFSQVSWDWEEVECPGPGRTYSNASHPNYNPSLPVMKNPARITFPGIVSRAHAEREGLYMAYTNALRRQFVNWTTELQGSLVYYGAPVMLAATLYNMQQGGEIRDYDEETGVMELTNGVRNGKIIFMKKDGSLTPPYDFRIVDADRSAIITTPRVDFQINYGDYATERTRYVILEGEMIRRIVKIMAVRPKGMGENGAPMYELAGVVDVPEVHWIDRIVPPDEPDEDPIDPNPDDPTPGGIVTLETCRIIMNQPGQYLAGPTVWISYDSFGLQSNSLGNFLINDSVFDYKWHENAPQVNLGAQYQIMFAIQASVQASDYSYVSGYKARSVAVDNFSSLDASTASALQSFFNGPSDGVLPYMWYTDWMDLDKTATYTETFSAPDPTPYYSQSHSWPQIVTSGRTYLVAIRDKATHTLQSSARHSIGCKFQLPPPPWI